MSIIRAYRDAVLKLIRTGVPEFKEVSSSPGVFNDEMIRRYAMQSPCCKVAFIGMRRMEQLSTGEWRGPVTMVGYVIAEDEPPLESYDVAVDLAEKLAGVIESTPLQFDRAGDAMVEEIENLYSLIGDKRGTSIVAVSWRQLLRFGVNSYDIDTAGAMVLGEADPEGLIIEGPYAP